MRKLTFIYESLQVPKYVGSGLALLFGLILLNHVIALSLVLFALALYLPLNFAGIEIVPQLKRYRVFQSHFGARKGSWRSLGKFKAVIILARHGKKKLVSPHLVNTIDMQEVVYDVFLADETHRKQLFLRTFDTYLTARESALLLARELKLPLERYNPRISEATRRRIRQRKLKRRR